MDIDDGNCQLLVSLTIDFQPAFTIGADLCANDCQALLRHKVYDGGGTISIFSTEICGRLISHRNPDPLHKYKKL